MNFTEEEAKHYLDQQGLMSHLRGSEGQLAPDWRDLARLHSLARKRKVFTALEFGVGRSTVVLADALYQNKREWEGVQDKPEIKKQDPFTLFSVDASEVWLKNAQMSLPQAIQGHVEFHHSRVTVGEFNGRVCHFFESIPDAVPDFIYLDGPDPLDVEGEAHGLSWKNPERTVMAGDILRIEPTLLPGTFVLIDGRTNNARFLACNLQRQWDIHHYEKEDVTTMELQEPALGERNRAQILYCLSKEKF
ncbi:MAG: hypothetical protein Q8P39_03440 [Candidatus Yanofskybacteria bacterium]|nr:hypothetical protein [Candidatus Yanofskybacteria bacterium]